MTSPQTFKIYEVEYVRKDNQGPEKLDGLSYCIVRTRNAGVVCGYVDFDGTTTPCVVVHHARQMWRWHSAFVLADLAQSGINDESKCKFSEPQSRQKIIESCQIFECTSTAAKTLIAAPSANR